MKNDAASNILTKMDDKLQCNKHIDYLKKEIQYLIDKKKLVNHGEHNERIEAEKQEKLSELKLYTDKLKSIIKEERDAKQKRKDVAAAVRLTDSIQFHKSDREGVRKVRESREKAQAAYAEYLEYERLYSKYESQDFPAFLFFHNDILEKYGVCPHLKMNLSGTSDEADKEESNKTMESRKEWVLSRDDGGALFSELQKELVEKTTVNTIMNDVENHDAKLIQFCQTIFTESQLEDWKKVESFAEKYVSSSIKTKRMKERFKTMTHELSLLFAQTNLPLHEYLTTKYNQQFVVNSLGSNNVSTQAKLQCELFGDQLEKYKETKELFAQKSKYVSNTVANLKHNLYLYFTNNTYMLSQLNALDNKTVSRQVGRYFKRWIALTTEEQDERFYSFADWHADKYFISSGLINKDGKADIVGKMAHLLQEGYKTKQITYRDFRWITKKGVIEQVKALRYNKETNKFFFATTFRKVPTSVQHKASAPKTIITHDNENLINEEILKFIIEQHQGQRTAPGSEDTAKQDREACIEKVKKKLKTKRISASDKMLLEKKYADMCEVIKIDASQ
jgi:hypothetical protein